MGDEDEDSSSEPEEESKESKESSEFNDPINNLPPRIPESLLSTSSEDDSLPYRPTPERPAPAGIPKETIEFLKFNPKAEITVKGRIFESKSNKPRIPQGYIDRPRFLPNGKRHKPPIPEGYRDKPNSSRVTTIQPVTVAGGPWRPTAFKPVPAGTTREILEYLDKNPNAQIDDKGRVFANPKP